MKRTESRNALTGKTPAELQTELEALLKEQFGLRMQVATQQLTNTSKLKDVRRGIARVRTLLGQRAAAAGTRPAADKQGARSAKERQ
jgi:large subunit ribosomal protein L29